MASYHAVIEHRDAFLFTPFGEQLARRYFSDEQIAALGVYGPRSKHAGKIKGKICWRKVARGGWVSKGSDGYGGVERRVGSVISAALMTAPWGEEGKVVAEWTKPITPPAPATSGGNAPSMGGESRYIECHGYGE